ncbi:flagellar motor protein [Parvularcula bermudensis HTCC2503]|uniref:Flagellar protein FliL n=1 Tax=Parvularcula bermudensis (strain ATCC BAA-594 / HTCC2503 / KCTC 12087) TaxID=314260 RepID=E0TH45_PARBH|nr:flagellar basal body-associated FliL family protein [Parvularcula bermudensis]ADM09629.1 flagellar motor protein [Parvularcula bermudensis HTCC2503]
MAAETEEVEPKKEGGGFLFTGVLSVVAAASTFGMVWFAAAPPPPVDAAACAGFTAEPLTPEEIEARTAKYVALEPFTVSLGPDAGAKHLRMSVALGRPADAVELSESEHLRLRDKLLERLRKVELTTITDPDGMPALKESLLDQAQATLGPDTVYNVLVTEFVMR